MLGTHTLTMVPLDTHDSLPSNVNPALSLMEDFYFKQKMPNQLKSQRVL